MNNFFEKASSLVRYKTHCKETFKIAWPCIVETLLYSIIFIADAAMVGRLGAQASAAVGVNQAVNWLINSMSQGFAVGATVLTAMNFGAKNYKNASHVARQAVMAAFLFGLLISATVFSLSNIIPSWVGADEDILADASSYLRIVSTSYFMFYMRFVCSGVLRGSGNTRIPMAVAILANAINIIGNYFWIYPTRMVTFFSWQFEVYGADMGVRGAALSTALSQAMSGVILLSILLKKPKRIDMPTLRIGERFKFRRDTLANILRVGLPTAFERVSLMLGMVVFQAQISYLGTVAISAHYLANTIESLSYLPAEGFAVAATTLVGQSIGAEKKDDAVIYSRVSTVCGGLMGAVCGTIFFVMPFFLFSLFTPDADVILAGGAALRVMAVVEPILCAQIVLVGVLRGAGDTKTPFIVYSIGIWVMRLSTAWLFAYRLGWGLTGAWLGMAFDITFRFFFLGARYIRGKWLHVKVSM